MEYPQKSKIPYKPGPKVNYLNLELCNYSLLSEDLRFKEYTSTN